MVGEGGWDMRERIRSEGRKGKTRNETRRQDWGRDGAEYEGVGVDGAQDQLEAGYRLAVELDDASLLDRRSQTLVARARLVFFALVCDVAHMPIVA